MEETPSCKEFLSGDSAPNKNPLGGCHRGFSFVKTDSPLALFSVVAISKPYLAIEPKSIHGSITGYITTGGNAIGS